MPILEWENLEHDVVTEDDEPYYEFMRAKIPEGWLVLLEKFDHEKDFSNLIHNRQGDDLGAFGWGWGYGLGGLTFVPDPEHKWDGGSIA